MNERPILFSGPMVRAILEGRKTQTRRVVRRNAAGRAYLRGRNWHLDDPNAVLACPYGQKGERLWVRETFRTVPLGSRHDETGRPCLVEYRASSGINCKWRPSIFMPRWASRITLEVVNVRVERLNDITEQDAMAEGVNWQDTAGMARFTAKKLFSELWNSINEKRGFGWNVNPSVWVVEFKRINQ